MQLEFTSEEYQERHTRVTDLLGKSGMDALIITAEPNINYYSGFRSFVPYWTNTRPYILIIPRNHDPVFIVQTFHRSDAARDSWIKDVRDYPGLIGVPVSQVVNIIKELGLLGKRIGMELGFEQRLNMPYNDFVVLKDGLVDCEIMDAADLIWEQRMIKSEAEIAAHRRACEIGDKVFNAVFRETHEGMSEKDVAKIIGHVTVEEGGEVGFNIILSGKGNYDRVAGNPTNRRLTKGDLLWIDLAVIANGYWCDYCRAGVVGGPTTEQNRLQDTVVEVTKKTAEHVRPGITAADLARYCGKVAADRGMDFSFDCGRLGHGMGLNSTEVPSIAVFDNTILEPGMVIAIEPGIINSNGTYIAEENLVVRPQGCELLTSTPSHLRTL